MKTSNEKLRALAKEWRELEVRLKTAEQMKATVDIASINELRYAGRRIVAAIINKDDQKIFDQNVNMAYAYFHNAQHDLTDSVLAYYNSEFKYLIKEYGFEALKKNDLYHKINEKIKVAQHDVRQSRRHMGEPRFAIYNNLTEITDDLISLYPKYELMHEKLESEKLGQGLWNWVSLVIGLIGMFLSLISLM